MAPQHNKLKLPRSLIEKLGGDETLYGSRNRRTRSEPRKELRKAARLEKKASRNGEPLAKRKKLQHREEPDVDSDEPEFSKPVPQLNPLREKADNISKPKPILKRTKKIDFTSREEDNGASISSTQKLSKTVRNKLAEDDEEIAALEKKLGLKGKKKLPQSFKDDGLDELLEGLDESENIDMEERKTRKAEGNEWLDRKRREKRASSSSHLTSSKQNYDGESSNKLLEEIIYSQDDDEVSDMPQNSLESSDDTSLDDDDELGEDGSTLERDDDFDGFESEEGDNSQPLVRIRENPYVAPTVGVAEKYIPPSLRKPASSDSEVLVRLRRRTQGLVNRLTEVNLISILGEIEKLYLENPRQHVTSTLVDILLISICEPTSLPDTLIILPAGFIAATYKIVGTDFGAYIVQRTIELFDEHYSRATTGVFDGSGTITSDSSKETSNLIMLLSELYNFQVIGSNLIFDYVRLFLSQLSELNAELLLKIIRTSGPQLRQDDPSSLKDIVTMLPPAVGSVGADNISVRTRFMIETINDLKNNKMRHGGAASAVTSEHTIRMKKTLGSLNNRSIKGSEPLRVSLDDIKQSDKKGKWWLVGASWSGNVVEDDPPSTNPASSKTISPTEDTSLTSLVELAREQRMNTDIRRAIFVTIMSATDYQEAYFQLMKLKLKRVQQIEIPKVLIHCAGAEKIYNPYYTLISKKICGDKRLRTAFQYSLWDLFKRMGESDEFEDLVGENGDTLDTRHIVNLAKMFGTLIAEEVLSLAILKPLNFVALKPQTKTFVEVAFITIFLQHQGQTELRRDEKVLLNIFAKVRESPNLATGLLYFLKKVVSKTDIAGGREEKAAVKWACKLARDTLQASDTMDTADD